MRRNAKQEFNLSPLLTPPFFSPRLETATHRAKKFKKMETNDKRRQKYEKVIALLVEEEKKGTPAPKPKPKPKPTPKPQTPAPMMKPRQLKTAPSDNARKSTTSGMRIFVKTTGGKSISLNVDSAETIAEIKVKLLDIEGIPTEMQIFVFAGKQVSKRARTN